MMADEYRPAFLNLDPWWEWHLVPLFFGAVFVTISLPLLEVGIGVLRLAGKAMLRGQE